MATEKTTQAMLDANNRYRKKSVKQASIQFFPSEHYLCDWAASQGLSRSAYIKQLIKEDYEKNH